MKKLITVFFTLMLVASFASAADFVASGTASGQTFSTLDDARVAVSITQNNDPGYITDGGSVACSGGGIATQNWFLCRFLLDDHGIAASLSVESVDFAVESVTGIGYSVDIVLFTIATGDPLLFANLTEIARTNVALADEDDLMFFNAAIAGTVNIGSDLVVAIDAPDGEATGSGFWPGTNDSGYLRESYIAAEGCGIMEPTLMSGIGWEGSQLILVVNGDADGTTATEDLTFSNIKSLY